MKFRTTPPITSLIAALIAAAALISGCSSKTGTQKKPDDVSNRSAGTAGETSKSVATSPSADSGETPIVADNGNYPFPLNSKSRLKAPPLPFDGKDWSQPDARTGAAIAAFASAGGIYSTACVSGTMKFFVIDEAMIVNQTAFFDDSSCSSALPQSTLSRIVVGQNIVQTGNVFDITGKIMDVTFSPKTTAAANDFNSAGMCGITDWTADTIISIIGAVCEGIRQPDAGSSVTAKITTGNNSITLGNGTTYTKQAMSLGITGGTRISAGTSMLALSTIALMTNQQPFCTATLISENYAVTAAHCIEAAAAMPRETLFAGFGENAARQVQIQSIIKHESYTDQNLNKGFTPLANYDVGLIKLAGNVPKPYRPVAILPAGESFNANEKVYIAGYGLDESGNIGALKASYSLFSEESPAAITFRTVSAVTQSTCNGDSGGPAYVVRGGFYYLTGATSYGPNGFNCRGGDSYFVDLRKVTSWLESRMN
ncbi:MAG: hypothetical protein EBR09_11765 [Proteobacteria bacterium]|nr:hypothetical protein [Pseudomonadota bacterium]